VILFLFALSLLLLKLLLLSAINTITHQWLVNSRMKFNTFKNLVSCSLTFPGKMINIPHDQYSLPDIMMNRIALDNQLTKIFRTITIDSQLISIQHVQEDVMQSVLH